MLGRMTHGVNECIGSSLRNGLSTIHRRNSVQAYVQQVSLQAWSLEGPDSQEEWGPAWGKAALTVTSLRRSCRGRTGLLTFSIMDRFSSPRTTTGTRTSS
jgi:hypothetical protein